MATIKSFTDVEQSKKLAEILPIESADMYYEGVDECLRYEPRLGIPPMFHTPCWSTAALLDIIRNNGRYELQMYEGGYYFEFYFGSSNFMTETYLNPVDACYEMIGKLYELKML